MAGGSAGSSTHSATSGRSACLWEPGRRAKRRAKIEAELTLTRPTRTTKDGALPVVSPGRKRAFGGCALVQIIRFTSWTVWGAVSAAGAQPYLGARTRIVRRQDDRWGVIPARCCLRPLGL